MNFLSDFPWFLNEKINRPSDECVHKYPTTNQEKHNSFSRRQTKENSFYDAETVIKWFEIVSYLAMMGLEDTVSSLSSTFNWELRNKETPSLYSPEYHSWFMNLKERTLKIMSHLSLIFFLFSQEYRKIIFSMKEQTFFNLQGCRIFILLLNRASVRCCSLININGISFIIRWMIGVTW